MSAFSERQITNMDDFEDMLNYTRNKGFDIQGKIVDSKKLIFEERVKMNCFYCGRYNVNWKCPPKLPQLMERKCFQNLIIQLLYGWLCQLKKITLLQFGMIRL